ncbi:hypothetical protein SLE2022_098780 [Rubroshorea leprosula]
MYFTLVWAWQRTTNCWSSLSNFFLLHAKLSSHHAPIPSSKISRNRQSPASYPCIRAVDLDQNTMVALSVGVVSGAIGIGLPVFEDDNAVKNAQPCFSCNGTEKCRFCTGKR